MAGVAEMLPSGDTERRQEGGGGNVDERGRAERQVRY